MYRTGLLILQPTKNRVTQAKFRCQKCGFVEHADINAARNILRLGQSQRPQMREALAV